MTHYYNHGKLTRTLSANGLTIQKGQWAVVSVEDGDRGIVYVYVCSGRVCVTLPHYGTDYGNLVYH